MPPQIDGTVVTAAALNPDVNGRPSPVRVYVFQLRTSGAFESADFVSLYQKPDAVLGADLLSSDNFPVQPGSSRAWSAELDPATRHLGVVVAFRDIAQAQWRAGLSLPEEDVADYLADRRLSIRVDELAVSMSLEPR